MKDATTLTSTPTSPVSGEQTTHDPATVATDSATPPVEPAAKPAADTAPESYTFKPPEGQTYDPKLIEGATPIFKELNLSQTQADKLVEFWNKSVAPIAAQKSVDIIAAQGAAWTEATMAAPDLGPKLDEHKITIARALDTVLTPDEKNKFIAFGDQTKMYNNPDVFRALVKMATKLAPGTHVSGAGPSPNGQSPNGQTQRPSIAEALYKRAS